MQARVFWTTVTADRSDLLGRFLTLLDERGVRWCVVGGVAVNAYVEPVVTLDLDLTLAADQAEAIESLLLRMFHAERFAHSLNISDDESDLRIQVQTDPRYPPFVARATPREVLGRTMPVAAVEDLLQGKVWAFQDATRRASKRQKDLADIARLIERFPHLRASVPADVLARLV